jgi:hypothetical protein
MSQVYNYLTKIKRLVVTFSIERLIAIYFPLKCRQLCTTTIKKSFCIGTILASLLIYSFNLVTTELKIHEASTRCAPHKEWIVLVEFITVVDVTFTMIVPFFIIFIINILIAFKLTNLKSSTKLNINRQSSENKSFQSFKNNSIKRTITNSGRNLLYVPTVTTSSLKLSNNLLKSNQSRKDLTIKFTKSSTNDLNEILKMSTEMSLSMNMSLPNTIVYKKRDKLYSKSTNVVLSISTTFLVLHCPIAICKLYSFLKYKKTNFLENEKTIYNNTSNVDVLQKFLKNSSNSNSYRNMTVYTNEPGDVMLDHLIERISNNIYYLSFLINFFLYSLNGSKFRNALIKMFKP